MSELIVFGFGFCIFCALWGYGNALLRLLAITRAPWPLAATTGISFLLALGGYLNLADYIVPPMLTALIIVGDVLAFWGARGQVRRFSRDIRKTYKELIQDPKSLIPGLLLVILLAGPVVRHVSGKSKLLQTR
ncbi:MAG: hypothetical protein ACJ74Z_12870 [Bryobacteraceae bacterium]